MFVKAADAQFLRGREQEFFDSGTANLDIFSNSSVCAYSSFRRFEYKSLCLLRSQIGPQFAGWLAVTERASNNEVSQEQLRTTREEILQYREQHLGLKGLAMERESSDDAITILFLHCLQDWSRKPESFPHSNIVQGIDEFAATYIEFFGRSEQLIAERKCQFNC